MADDGRIHIAVDGSLGNLDKVISDITSGFREVKAGASELSRMLDSDVTQSGYEMRKAFNEAFSDVQRTIDETYSKLEAAVGEQELKVKQLSQLYGELNKEIERAYEGGNGDSPETKELEERAKAVKDEIRNRQELLNSLGDTTEKLTEEESKLKSLQGEVEKTSHSHNSLRKRMREITLQLVEMEAAGERGTEAYQKLQEEAGRLRDSFADAQKQVSIMAHDNAGLQGVISAVSGVAGAFSAAQGVMGLFTDKSEELQKVMLKVQSLMSITVGLQQVANTLNKDSFLNVAILQKIRARYNIELAKSTAGLAGATAAQSAQNASAVAGTVANTGLAGAFRMVGAAIKSIPVFGWIAAAIGAIIAVVGHFVSKAAEARKQQEELNKAYREAASNNIASNLTTFKKLQAEWKAANGNIDKQRALVAANKKEWEKLGLKINSVNEYEKAVVENSDAVVKAMMLRAKAAAKMSVAEDQFKKVEMLRLEAEEKAEEKFKNWQPETKARTAKGRESQKRAAKDKWIADYLSDKNIDKFESIGDDLIRDAQQIKFESEKIIAEAGLSLVKGDEKANETIRKNAERAAKELIALRRSNKKEELALEDDGTAKKIALIKNEYQQRVDAIEQTRKEWQKLSKDGQTLTKDQQKALDDAEALARKKMDKGISDVLGDDIKKTRASLQRYLKEYGSFQDKRLAITQEYADKIKEAQKGGNVFEVASLRQELNKALTSVDASELMSQLDLANVFGDLGLVLSEPLKQTLEQLRQFTATDKFKSLAIDQQKAVFEAIADAEKQLGGVAGLNMKEVGKAIQSYELALSAQSKAQRDLAIASANLASAEELAAKATKGNDEEQKKIAETLVSQRLNEHTAALEAYNNATARVAQTQSSAAAAIQKFNASVNRIEGGIKSLYNGSISGFLEMFGSELPNSIGRWLSGASALQKQSNNFIASLTANGKTLADISAEVAGKVTSTLKDFSGSSSEAVKAVQENLSGLFDGYGMGNNLKKNLGSQISDILTETLKDGVQPESLQKAGEAVGDLIEGLGKAGEESGNIWGIIIGIVLQLLDEFKEHGLGEIVRTLLEQVGDAVEGILSNFFVDLIPAIIMGLDKLVTSVMRGLFKFLTLGLFNDADWLKTDDEKFQESIEPLKSSIDTLSKSIYGLKNAISKNDSSSEDAQKAYDMAVANLAAVTEKTKSLMVGTADASKKGWIFGWGSKKSSSQRINENVSGGSWDAISAVVGRAVRSASDFFSLTAEEMRDVSLYATNAYDEVLAASRAGYQDASGYIEQYKELAGKLQELQSALFEKLTGISWDSFYGDFKSMLKDMDSSATDFANNFKKNMSDAILESLVNSKYKDKLQRLYNQFASAMGEGSDGGASLTQQEIEALKNERENIVKEALDERNQLIKSGLIQSQSANAEASRMSVQNISETTASAIEGRMTAIQLQQRVVTENVTFLRADVGTISQNISEIRGLSLNCIGHLSAIAKNTEVLPAMNERLGEIEKKIREL